VDTTQLLKGVLGPSVLAVLDDEDGYGYDVVRRLRSKGLDHIGDASVYGTLRRLYDSGYLSSYVVPSASGPNRKYYAVTKRGRKELKSSRKRWAQFSRTLDTVLNGNGEGKSDA
jgi:PadR family transcriptional regulator PadR